MERFKVTSRGRDFLRQQFQTPTSLPESTTDLLAKQAYDPTQVAYESQVDRKSKMVIDDIIEVQVRQERVSSMKRRLDCSQLVSRNSLPRLEPIQFITQKQTY